MMRNPTPAAFPGDDSSSPTDASPACEAVTRYQVGPLSSIQLDLLLLLARSPYPLSLEDIRRLTRLPPTTLRWLLEPLVQRGLVKRVLPLPGEVGRSVGEQGGTR